VYHEEDKYGNELIYQLTTGNEFYDFLMRVKEERELGKQRFRY